MVRIRPNGSWPKSEDGEAHAWLGPASPAEVAVSVSRPTGSLEYSKPSGPRLASSSWPALEYVSVDEV